MTTRARSWCGTPRRLRQAVAFVTSRAYARVPLLLTHSFCFPELRYTTQAPAHALLRELLAFYVQDDYDMVAIAALRDAHCVILRLHCDAHNPVRARYARIFG